MENEKIFKSKAENYYKNVLSVTLILFVCSLIVIWIKGFHWSIFIIFALVLITIASEKKVIDIAISSQEVAVTYYSWLIKNNLKLDRRSLISTFSEYSSLRASKRLILILRDKDKKIEIDSVTGFNEDDLSEIKKCLEH